MSMVNPVQPIAQFQPTAASVVAFDRCKAEISEIARGAVEVPRVDLGYAARVFLTIAGNVAPYKEALLKLGVDETDNLVLRAQAMNYAHALHAWTLTTPPSLDTLAAPVYEARRALLAELEILQLRGVFAADAIKLQRTKGYLVVATDVRTIASAFLASWDKVGPEVGNNIQRVNDALVVADRLTAAVAESEEIEEKLQGTAKMRAAAWALALKSFHEINRGIAFIRYHEGDASEIVPSPFDRSDSPRKKPQEETPVVAADPSTAVTAPLPVPPSNGAQPNIPATPIKPSRPFEV